MALGDLFKKKSRTIKVGDQTIELEPKPTKGPLSFLNPKSQKAKPQAQTPTQPKPQQRQAQPSQQPQQRPAQPQAATTIPKPQPQGKDKSILGTLGGYVPASKTTKPDQSKTSATKLSFKDLQISEAQAASTGVQQKSKFKPPAGWKRFIEATAAKQKGLEAVMREQGMKMPLYDFVQRMMIASILLSLIITITILFVFIHAGLSTIESVAFAGAMGLAIFQGGSRTFLQYPFAKGKSNAKIIERDILFAARDMIISLRSGMPLFNALTSISTGYGEASKEFAKIIERVQLGMPLEEAIDAVIAQSRSASFRRIMLQASVSIKAGADVVSALQSVIDQLAQERIIELRAYGQRLNALAMFYMLFGVILPSMGIAVITILTTFIAIFTVDNTVLEFVLVFILFLQIMFLQLIRTSRPVFSM